MCFVIDKDGRKFDGLRAVYKIVRTRKDGRFQGPHYPGQYTLGKEKKRNEGATSEPGLIGTQTRAKHGIYVYKDYLFARALCESKNHCHKRPPFVVLKCLVQPKDLLHESTQVVESVGIYNQRGRWTSTEIIRTYAATYEKVTPTEIMR